jgi:hypothetical protein
MTNIVQRSPTLVDKMSPQSRLNKFLASRPEIISMKDNLVDGTVVAELPFAAVGVIANDGWLAATLGPCRLMTFRFL